MPITTKVVSSNQVHLRSVLDTTLCDKVCQRLVAGRWFSLCTPVFSTNKTDCHDITEILLKVDLNTIILTLTPSSSWKMTMRYFLILSIAPNVKHWNHRTLQQNDKNIYQSILCGIFKALIFLIGVWFSLGRVVFLDTFKSDRYWSKINVIKWM